MPVSRMRMRPWLEQKINSNSIYGLNWVDKDKTMFSIPWKHAARHGWELDKDASLFKEWAIHTGKYVEGQACDPKTWKANFRCAMNSLPDIEEVKDKSVNKGHQAMRVFRMLPAAQKSRDKRSKARESQQKSSRVKMEEEMDYSDAASSVDESSLKDSMSPQENTIDSTVRSESPDFTFAHDVPDWSLSVEVGPESAFTHRFEVSPVHDSDYDWENEEIIKICSLLEGDSHWSSLEGTGFLSNEACTSPGSQWSESSSVDELDDTPRYMVLGPDSFTPDVWQQFQRPSPLL